MASKSESTLNHYHHPMFFVENIFENRAVHLDGGMANGRDLVGAFKKLGCPQSGELAANSFDHLFEDDELRSFLKHFCGAVETGELVSLNQRELATLDKLESGDRGLDEDLVLKTAGSVERSDRASGIESRLSLENEICHLKNRRDDLVEKCRVLRDERQRVDEELLQVQRKVDIAEKDQKQKALGCRQQRLRLSETVDQLGKTLEKMFDVDLEENRLQSIRNAPHPDFYFAVEGDLLLQVRNYCLALIKKSEEKADTTDHWNREYRTLRRSLNEIGREAVTVAAAERSRVKALELFGHKYTETCPTDTPVLREKTKRSEWECERNRQELGDLLKQCSADRPQTREMTANIAAANYRLRLQRLDHLSLTLQRVLQVLLWQRSRLDLMQTMVRQESQQWDRLGNLVDDVRDSLLSHPSFPFGDEDSQEYKSALQESENDQKTVSLTEHFEGAGLEGDWNRLPKRRLEQSTTCWNLLQEDVRWALATEETLQLLDHLVAATGSGVDVRKPLDSLVKGSRALEKMLANLVKKVKVAENQISSRS